MSSPDEPQDREQVPAWGTKRYPPGSYAYKPPWAQPHYALPKQRAAPPKTLYPAAAPITVPDSVRNPWTLLGVAGASCAVLVVVAALIWRPYDTTGTSQPAVGRAAAEQAPTPPAAPSQSDQTLKQALYAWWKNGAETLEDTVLQDLEAARAAADSNDSCAMQTSCESLRSHVEAFQAFAPGPDLEFQTHLTAALAQDARGATDCLAGVATNSSALISTADQEFDAASSELAQATARVNTINGN